MLSQHLIDLTAHTQKCFGDTPENVLDFLTVVGDIWTVLDLDPKHNIFISAQSDYTKPTGLLLTVGRNNFQNAGRGTVVQKQYDVTQGQLLDVVTIHVQIDDMAGNWKMPRQLSNHIVDEKSMPAGQLAAILIEDIKEFMTPENKIRLGNRLDEHVSDSPIVAAMKSMFPPVWQPFDGPDKNGKNLPQSTPDGPQ